MAHYYFDTSAIVKQNHKNTLLKAVNLELVFVTSDRTLLRAAQAEGLQTENPYDHAD